MPIPDYQAFMLPLLRYASDGKEHDKSEAVKDLSDQFNLTKEDREALLVSGSNLVMNRISWAETELEKAILLFAPKRDIFQITDRGKELLATAPKEVRTKTLEQYDEFNAFKTKIKALSSEENEHIAPPTSMTPEEALDWAFQKLTESLSDNVSSTSFFEKLVVDLIVKMG